MFRLLLSFALVGAISALELPHFSFEDCDAANLPDADICVKIVFGSEGEGRDIEELAALNFVGDYDDILEGYLPGVFDSRISVNLDGDVTEVMISTPDELYTVIITGDLENGHYEFDSLPNDGTITWDDPPVPDERERERIMSTDLDENRAAYPTTGFELKVHVVYDKNFQRRFGSSVQNKIDKIFNMAETFFRHSTLETRLKPKITKVSFADKDWTATSNNLRDFRSYVGTANLEAADAMVALSSESDRGGTIGIAWVGTTCSRSTGLRTSLNEYFRSDTRTAQVVVHEIGHNLNMGHDFQRDGSDRFSTKNEKCTGIGGYMDYVSNPTRWSPCSVEDFERYYRAQSRFCLTPLTDGGSTTAPPASSTAAPTTAPTAAPTAAPTQPPTGAPEECKDLAAVDCFTLKENCNSTKAFWNIAMPLICPKTCGLCTGECVDIWSQGKCQRRKKKGRCSLLKVSVNCQKTCEVCSSNV